MAPMSPNKEMSYFQVRIVFHGPRVEWYQSLSQNEDGTLSQENRKDLVNSLMSAINEYIISCQREERTGNQFNYASLFCFLSS